MLDQLCGALVGLDKSNASALNYIGHRCPLASLALISIAERPLARIAALDGTAAAEPVAGHPRRYAEIAHI